MNIKDIDNKTAAVVLRRSQEISNEHSTRIVTESLRDQKIPEPLIQKMVKICRKLGSDSMPKLDSIMGDLEGGNVGFDDTVIALMKFSIEIGQESSERIRKMMEESIASGELDEYMAAEEAGEEEYV